MQNGNDLKDYELVILGRSKFINNVPSSKPSGDESTPVYEKKRKRLIERYQRVPGFFFSETAWAVVWQDPYWYTSVLLEIGFVGLFIAAYISLLQVETVIARAWIFWIFSVVQICLMGIHTLVYSYYHLNQVWSNDLSIPQLARLRAALIMMWCAVILVLTMTTVFVWLPEVPACCTNEIVGLTIGAIDVYLVVQWNIIMVLSCVLFFGAAAENFVAIISLLYPEKMVHDAVLLRMHEQEKHFRGTQKTN